MLHVWNSIPHLSFWLPAENFIFWPLWWFSLSWFLAVVWISLVTNMYTCIFIVVIQIYSKNNKLTHFYTPSLHVKTHKNNKCTHISCDVIIGKMKTRTKNLSFHVQEKLEFLGWAHNIWINKIKSILNLVEHLNINSLF